MENETIIFAPENNIEECLTHLEYLVRKTMRNRMSEEVVLDCMNNCLEVLGELKTTLKGESQ